MRVLVRFGFAAAARAHLHALAGPPEEAQHLGRRLTGAAEPVRHPGVELGDLPDAEHQVLVAEDQSHPAGQDVEPLVAVMGSRARASLPMPG